MRAVRLLVGLTVGGRLALPGTIIENPPADIAALADGEPHYLYGKAAEWVAETNGAPSESARKGKK